MKTHPTGAADRGNDRYLRKVIKQVAANGVTRVSKNVCLLLNKDATIRIDKKTVLEKEWGSATLIGPMLLVRCGHKTRNEANNLKKASLHSTSEFFENNLLPKIQRWFGSGKYLVHNLTVLRNAYYRVLLHAFLNE